MTHQPGDVTEERITSPAPGYPVRTVWAGREEGFAWVPTGWPHSEARAALLGTVAAALGPRHTSKRLEGEVRGHLDMLRHEFDVRPQDCAEDVAAWALVDNLLGLLLTRAYVRNHAGNP